MVVHYPGMPAGTVGTPSRVPATLMNKAHELASEAAMRARKVLDHDDVETQILVGAPAEALIGATRSVQLLAVGNRGRSELASALLGSVSFAAAAYASCPVVVVCEDALLVGPQRGVVVGVDGSAAGERALDLAAEVAASAGASLRVICAWDVPFVSPWAHAYWEAASPDADLARTQHDNAVRVATEAAARARSRHRGLSATSEAREGPAAAVLSQASRDAGLVLVGSRGRGGFAGLALGSVSHRVIHSSACPVMVVRG